MSAVLSVSGNRAPARSRQDRCRTAACAGVSGGGPGGSRAGSRGRCRGISRRSRSETCFTSMELPVLACGRVFCQLKRVRQEERPRPVRAGDLPVTPRGGLLARSKEDVCGRGGVLKPSGRAPQQWEGFGSGPAGWRGAGLDPSPPLVPPVETSQIFMNATASRAENNTKKKPQNGHFSSLGPELFVLLFLLCCRFHGNQPSRASRAPDRVVAEKHNKTGACCVALPVFATVLASV